MTTVGQTWRRRKRERPEEILTAAHIEFCANPFGAVTMSQIAKRAGISKGTIYLYFSSKDELLSAIAGEVWHQTSVRHVARRFGASDSA